jgi:hypothetical protein
MIIDERRSVMGCARDNRMVEESLRMQGIYTKPSSEQLVNKKSFRFEVTVIKVSCLILKLFEKSIRTVSLLF